MADSGSFPYPGAISCDVKQSAKIRTGSAVNCMAGRQLQNNYYNWYIGGCFRLHHEPVYRLYGSRSGKNQADLYAGRHETSCPV